MNDTLVTLVGNAATGVEFRETATGGMARFRFAVTPRRWDRGKQLWTDGHTSFYTVWAWRTLASNLSASVSVGEPLVVHGRLKVREEEREDRRRTFVDIEAVAVGHDLTRGTAAFRRVMRGEPGPVVHRGSVDGAVDRGDGPGRSDEPDWSGVPARGTREAQDEREGGGEQSERVEQAEQAEQSEQAKQAERVGRQRVRRPTVRQKRGQELASVS
ncbi:single-stranded DNA-binding protein [Streptomyces sp. NPDC060286]|uniref:single-stranded DNA-binding protein n=1 Tax=unclassified Streptomyces TaxID=2593676 RepID=UPI0035DE00E3